MKIGVCLFAYNRLYEFSQMLLSLSHNDLTNIQAVHLFLDGPKNNSDAKVQQDIKKEFLRLKCANKYITHRVTNLGLASNIYRGLDSVSMNLDAFIVIEDDLVLSSTFIGSLCISLENYKADPHILSISGYSSVFMRLLSRKLHGQLQLSRVSSWGWATWADRWQDFRSDNWRHLDYRPKLKRIGPDLIRMSEANQNGRINSWAVVWQQYAAIRELRTVYFIGSQLRSIGFDKRATHTTNKYKFWTAICEINSLKRDTLLLPKSKSRLGNLAVWFQFTRAYSSITFVISRLTNLIL